MDTQRKFLNGDIHWLENVNKIVPRKMELPLLMQSSEFSLSLLSHMKFPIYFIFPLRNSNQKEFVWYKVTITQAYAVIRLQVSIAR